jgi:NADH-quinone oxidoreductase subunit A
MNNQTNFFLEFAGLAMYSAMALAVALAMLLANRFLGPKTGKSAEKQKPFECGLDPVALPSGHVPVHFYVIAMLFVVLDVELIFLFPWAVIAKELGWFGLLQMGFFLAVIIIGFAYAWKKGALYWQSSPSDIRKSKHF